MKRINDIFILLIVLLTMVSFSRVGHRLLNFNYEYIDLNDNWVIKYNEKIYKTKEEFIKSIDNKKQNDFVRITRSFEVHSALKNTYLAISLGGISYGQRVYINGHLIGESPFDNFIYNNWNMRYSYFIPNEFINYNGLNTVEIEMKLKSIYDYDMEKQSIYIAKNKDVILKDKFINDYLNSSIYFGLSLVDLIMAIYFINMYRLNRFSSKYLYFGLTLIFLAIYYTNYFASSSALSYLSFQKLVFASLYLSVVVYIMFLRKSQGLENTKFVKILIHIYIIIFAMMMLFTKDMDAFSLYRKRFYVFFILALAYIIYLSIVYYKTYKFKKTSYLIVHFICILFILHDILIDLSIIKRHYPFQINSYGIMIILFYMGYDLSKEQNSIYINSIVDALTGLYNRRFLDSYICNAYSKKSTYTLLLLDFDNFKHINDYFGHVVGDEVLKNSAKIIQQLLTSNCIAARFGGEEFVIFCEKDKDFTVRLAEKIRYNIEEYDWQKVTGKEDINVTVSIGAIEFTSDDDFMKVLERVDEVLYRAKKNGKNRVEWAEQ